MEYNLKQKRICDLIASMERMRRAQKTMRSKHSHDGPIFPLIEFANACGDDSVPISKLAEVFGVSAAAATQFITKMSMHGYVVREENPQDRRQVMVRISDKGKATVKEAQAEFMETMSGLLDYLGEEDSLKMNAIIEKIAEYFNQGKQEQHEKENKA